MFMATQLPEQSGGTNIPIPLDALEFSPGCPALLEVRALPLGRQLEVFDDKGRFIAAIKKNTTGNDEKEKSYTLEFQDGKKMLIPVPYFCSLGNFLVDARDNEDIELSLPQDSGKYYYRVADQGDKDVSSIRPKVVEHRELKEEWQEFALEDDQSLVLYAENNGILARIYKAAHTSEYILRDPRGVAHAHIFEGEEYEAGNRKGNRLQYEVQKGKFRIKGEPKINLVVEKIPSRQKIQAGRDGFLTGVINGGRQIAIASYREVGRVKDAYVRRNEDNAGFNVDTAVEVDGIGGNVYGHLASDYAAESVLNGNGSFKDVIQDTHDRMDNFVQNCRQQQQERQSLEDDWFQKSSSQKDAQTKEKYLVPDAVMSAVRFEGDKMRTMVLGDGAVYVIRDDMIVYKSREHTVVAMMIAQGRMTRRDAMISGLRSQVSTTVVGSFDPDFDEFQLQKGDKVLLMSDGGIMPDGVILLCVSGQTAEKGVENLLDAKREENEFGGAYYDPDDGGAPQLVSSMDNTTYLMIDHD